MNKKFGIPFGFWPRTESDDDRNQFWEKGGDGWKISKYLGTLTKRQLELVMETCAKMDFFEPIVYDQEFLKSREDYEKAYYGTCWKSEKKRKAFDFLRAWHHAAIWDKESERPRKNRDRLLLLAPLLSALEKRDAEFFRGLAEAVQILNDRIYNSKNPNIGSGEMHLTKWLLEHKVRNWPDGARQTPRELNEQFVSKFRKISDKKLHQKLHELGIPHKDEPRGKASPNYGNALLNLSPKRRKTG